MPLALLNTACLCGNCRERKSRPKGRLHAYPKKSNSYDTAESWKFGGAAGEPPPGSEKPDCRFLQAQLRIYLSRASFSKPEFRAQQMQLFLGASRISLSVLAVLYDRGKDGNGNLSPTVVT